ncbi:MAG: efflux RND transporter periplasmic adaptor subunit, partial [Pseudomonadota bacterium]
FEAFSHAPIYARVNGYLKNWKVDIGAQVKAGQLLGEIETPDLDQQLLQARANLDSAQANVELAATTAKRWQAMLKTDAVSKQEVDDRTSDLSAKESAVKAAKANVDQLLATKSFARIVAPFDGVVTARETDTGALINAGSGSGTALFEISDMRKLRLYVNVPQNYVDSVKPGTKADITVPERAAKTYTAVVASTSRAIDVASGTVLVQLVVDNAAAELLAGGFANVSLHLPSNASVLSIPASALIFDKAGLRVATVNADGKVLLKAVTIARDLGKTIELGSGVMASDRIIESPPDGVTDGDIVHVIEPDVKQADASTISKKHNPEKQPG